MPQISSQLDQSEIQSVTEEGQQSLAPIFVSCYPAPLDGDRTEVGNQACIELLRNHEVTQNDELISSLDQSLAPYEKPSAEVFGQLRFIESLFEFYFSSNNLDPQINQTLNSLVRLSAAWQLNNERWIWDATNPLRQALSLVQTNAIGWQTENGKSAQRFVDNLRQHLLQICNQWLEPADAISDLQTFFNKEKDRSCKLEKRLRDAERGALRARHSQQFSITFLNDQIAGQKFPACISQFLLGDWLESLRLHLIKHTEHSPEWENIAKLTETLVWSFQPCKEGDSTTKQGLYNAIPDLHDEIRDNCINLLHNSEQLEQQLALMDAQHLNVLKGVELTYDDFDLISCDDPLESSAVKISSALKGEVEALAEQQWFIRQENGQTQRLKLVLKLDDAQQLLFCNQIGQKSAQYSFDEFAYLLSIKTVKPLLLNDSLVRSADQIVEALTTRHELQQEKLNQQLQMKAELERRNEQRRAEAREKALEEAERLAKIEAERKQAEIDTLKLAEQQRRQSLMDAEKKAGEDRLQQYTQKMEQLTMGSIVEFTDEFGETARCKLAVKMKSSGRYIFVNNAGIKERELQSDDLIEQLMNGSANIVNLGIQFEDTLAQVVSSLRKKER